MISHDHSHLCSQAWPECARAAARLSESTAIAVPDRRDCCDSPTSRPDDSLTVDGERTVLRTFAPTPPAEVSDVLAVLVAEGESDEWLFTDRSATLAVGTKEIDGRPWMVSVVVSDDTVQQLFAGR